MEATMGGAPFFDGEWESICGMLSIDQDSDFATLLGPNFDHHHHHHQLPRIDDCQDSEGLLSLLLGDANNHPITSSSPQFYTQDTVRNPNSISQLSCISTSTCTDNLSNSWSSGCMNPYVDEPCPFVQPYNDDQISSLSSLDFFADDVQDTKRERDDQIPGPKKRARVSKDGGKVKRKAQPRKTKVKEVVVEEEEEDRKSSCEASDNDESIVNLKGKKRASRGAATDPQSLYARRRRERINERLRILQTLVPNGTKVDISTMLEEAVNYVKFLQLQIKLLSSDEMWMYAPLAYNGFDVGHYNRSWP